jgi:UDP-N-acetylmuramoyl-tripeptide--D-alanyl-D-alanine ligase
MKSLARSVFAGALALIARAVLAKYKPQIVMVTGSVGKTSTKDAVAAALSERYYLRASEKSYNSEFGVPLTIIGAKNPWTNVGAWLKVFQEGIALVLFPAHYPKLLVLEVGADRPGDLKQILRIATPDAVVVTRLPEIPVHVEAYPSAEAVREEEFLPAYALPADGALVISADDQHARRLSARLPARVSMFGFSDDADVRLSGVRAEGNAMQVTAHAKGKDYTLKAKGALGRSQIFAPAAAFALARALGVSEKDALKGLEGYVPPAGRARILNGIKDSTIIDDTYNASPAAVEEVLGSLRMREAMRRIAVLGDMLELGRYSTDEHERIGRLAAEAVEVVVSVGPRARAIASAARQAGGCEVMEFADSFEVAEALPSLLQEGDLVLIKGSQSIRMERIAKALLARPEDARLLVRQDPQWLKKG